MFTRQFEKAAQLITLLAFLASFGSAAEQVRSQDWNFDDAQPSAAPENFLSATGRWEVLRIGDNQVLAQQAENRDPVFNVTLIESTSYRDVDVRVRIKAVAGENECGGGVIWRARDDENYYLVSYNPCVSRHKRNRPHFRLYKVESGKRTQLDHADVAEEFVDDGAGPAPRRSDWHTVRITMRRNVIAGYLDDVKLLEADDSTFLDVGKIGLWTKSDARTYFDDLKVSTFPEPKAKP